MRRFTRCISIMLVVVMLCGTTVFATENANQRSSSYFWGSGTYLHKTSETTFEAWFDVAATHSMLKLGASSVQIQRSSDGENWTTMRTYSMTSYPNLICENTVAHTSYVTYTGTSGYYYRAMFMLYAKDSSGTGYMPRYSEVIKL